MRIRLQSLHLALLFLFVAPTIAPASAQTGIYASFTGVRPASGSDWLYGPTVGVYADRHSLLLLHLGIDLRGSVLNGSNNSSLVDGLGGIRASVVPHVVPFKIYGEGLVGAGVLDVNTAHVTRFQYQVNGGLEYTFFPRLDWRVAEASYSGFTGNSTGYDHPFGVSTGVVLRLP